MKKITITLHGKPFTMMARNIFDFCSRFRQGHPTFSKKLKLSDVQPITIE